MKRIFTFVCLVLCLHSACAQTANKDSLIIRQIYETALSEPKAYEWLEYLCKKIGGRLAGSPEASAAVEFTRQIMDTLGRVCAGSKSASLGTR
jgi:hypothetical protein